MKEVVQNDENAFGMVPPSTGKKKKARRVFGNILSNGDLNHSLSYSPSPMKKGPKVREGSQSPSRKSEGHLVTNLFSIAEGGSQPAAKGSRKSEMSSSQQSACRSEGSSVVVKPFTNIMGSPDDDDSPTNVPRSIRVPSEKNSADSKLSVEHAPFYSKQERLSKTAKPHRGYKGLPPSSSTSGIPRGGMKTNGMMVGRTGGSVNQALNAARRARERTLKEKAKAAATIRGQWKDEKDEALEFFEETQRLRREQLNLQNQLSSNLSRAKAQSGLNNRQAEREKTEKEAIFKSDVAREQREKLKEMEDRRRRESVAVRAKIRSNNREGAEKLKLIQIEEEKAIHEERHASSEAFQQYQRDRLDSERKNYQIKRDDAIRGRDLHDSMVKQRKEEDHEGFELMMAASRDVDEYRNGLARQRRESLESRNARGLEQRLKAKELQTNEKQAEHESYELKRASEKDVEDHKRSLEDKRRVSLVFRGEEAQKHREIMSAKDAEQQKLNKESYNLKFQGDKDVEEYKQKEAIVRRKSLEQRGAAAREIRQKQIQDDSQRQEQEHTSFELKFAGEKDVEEYRKLMEEKRRESLQKRNQEATEQRKEDDKRQAQVARAAHESYELKWEGERDAHEYLRQTEQERRDSIKSRNLEAQRQRENASKRKSADQKADHESFELKRAANKDVDEYRKKMEQERRDSLVFRNKEKSRHAKVMAELDTIAKEQEAESYALKWGGENDAKAYQTELEEERRNSIRFRNEEAKRHRAIDDDMRKQELVQKQKDEELKAGGHKDMQDYRDDCAERERASLEFRGKEATIRRLEDMNATQRQREVDERNQQLESLARIDVQEYIKSRKSQRRKSLAMRAKEKRRHAEWVRREEQKQIEQRANDTRLRARDHRSVELARQKEKTERALDNLRHSSCSFSGIPASHP